MLKALFKKLVDHADAVIRKGGEPPDLFDGTNPDVAMFWQIVREILQTFEALIDVNGWIPDVVKELIAAALVWIQTSLLPV